MSSFLDRPRTIKFFRPTKTSTSCLHLPEVPWNSGYSTVLIPSGRVGGGGACAVASCAVHWKWLSDVWNSELIVKIIHKKPFSFPTGLSTCVFQLISKLLIAWWIGKKFCLDCWDSTLTWLQSWFYFIFYWVSVVGSRGQVHETTLWSILVTRVFGWF